VPARPKKDPPQMLKEHKAVVAALKKLVNATKEEKKMEYARFAEELMLHAITREEVLYQAAIFGEYLNLKG
jgi:hypothetical protein